MSISWEGVFSALTTKFTPDDTLDLRMFEINLLAQMEAGVSGVIIGGLLGEASVLRTAEKEALVKFSVEKVEGRIPVLMNIAEGSTQEAMRQVDLARYWGARGLMLWPPVRYHADTRETALFFKTIASSTDLPIMLCHSPAEHRVEAGSEVFEELMDCQNIQAVKENTQDVSNITRMISRFGERFKILCGQDMIAMPALMTGAAGWVGGLAGAFPAETVAMYGLIKAGRMTEALAIYRWWLPLLELDNHDKSVQYIKLAEAETGLGTEYVRAPRLTLIGKEREHILRIIRECLSVRPALASHAGAMS